MFVDGMECGCGMWGWLVCFGLVWGVGCGWCVGEGQISRSLVCLLPHSRHTHTPTHLQRRAQRHPLGLLLRVALRQDRRDEHADVQLQAAGPVHQLAHHEAVLEAAAAVLLLHRAPDAERGAQSADVLLLAREEVAVVDVFVVVLCVYVWVHERCCCGCGACCSPAARQAGMHVQERDAGGAHVFVSPSHRLVLSPHGVCSSMRASSALQGAWG